MTRNPIRTLAIICLALGAVLLAGPAFGFDTITADRSVSVNVVDDPNAYLGIDAQDNIGELAGNDDPTEIATLTNNIDEQAEIDITVEEIPDGNESVLYADTDNLNLNSGESTTAKVECAQPESLGEQDVVFRTEATGSSVSITDATFTVTIDIQCGKGGGNVEPTDSGLSGVSVTDMDLDETNESQIIEFAVTEDLPTNETVTVTLAQVNQIDYSGATLSNNATGSIQGDSYEVEFNREETISARETVTIAIDRIDTTHNNADGDYDAEFERSDKDDPELLEPAFTVE
ncbi:MULTISPECIES: hypothetical protein [Natrialbaceae]|uniref:hypothetical protein n=1 Tax=Natrialbaceae TaxID=1644061 RepID=UPI00207C4D56|nr:hypothetical protein [Natronococcus sp. CG52]